MRDPAAPLPNNTLQLTSDSRSARFARIYFVRSQLNVRRYTANPTLIEAMTKDEILRRICEIAETEGGNVSMRRFFAVSGIKEKQVLGAYWPTWNDAKREAGLETRVFARARLQEVLVPAVARLITEVGRWPTENEQRMARRKDQSIPVPKVFRRLSSDSEFLRKLVAHCERTAQLEPTLSTLKERLHASLQAGGEAAAAGYAYLMRSGRRYKIGHTSSPSRRHREVRLDLPERTDLMHSIETDDPRKIEQYWHTRFAEKRIRETEFFELSAADVAAFRKRKFQ